MDRAEVEIVESETLRLLGGELAGVAAPFRLVVSESAGSRVVRVPLLAGGSVVLEVPAVSERGAVVDLLVAELRFASEECCDRTVVAVNEAPGRLLRGHRLWTAADIGHVEGVSVYEGAGGHQLLALDGGPVTVLVIADLQRPFTPAELEAFRDHLLVMVVADGSVRVEATPPIVVDLPDEPGTPVAVVATPDGSAGVTVVSHACPEAGSDSGACVACGGDRGLGLGGSFGDWRGQVGFAAGSCPAASRSTDGAASGRTHPRVAVLAGGADSGLVVAIDRWTGRTLWIARVGTIAFVADVEEDLVTVGGGGGREVVLDVYTGAVSRR